MEYAEMTTEEVTKIIKASHNWKAPGHDRLQNFWWKVFTTVHPLLARQFTNIIQNPNEIPPFLTKGITYLIPKEPSYSKSPEKYRPITCLPTIYKILTCCIAEKIYQHVHHNKIMAIQQKGCARNSMGCKEQLIIDSVILEQVKKQSRNLHVTYTDYQKTYDSVPHSWLVYALSLYKIHPIVVQFLKSFMQTWHTTLILNANQNTVQIDNINIKRGIFQGDAFSPLWFTLAINPLSTLLNSTQYGFKMKDNRNTQYTISHMLYTYMDDLLMYATATLNHHYELV
jgi:hypothetical protein